MAKPAKLGSYISQAWLVIILALVYGAALAAVQIGWSGRIEQNKRDKIYDQIPALVPAEGELQVAEVPVVGTDGRETLVYRVATADGALAGWVLRGSGQGFADVIDLLVGLDPEMKTITGLAVLGQKETPGLGDYITDGERFTNQFNGKQTPLAVVKRATADPHEIQALTGATISSESVATIATRTVDKLREAILQTAVDEAKE